MRSPNPYVPESAARTVLAAFIALVLLAAAGLLLLRSAPQDVLDGLTSPASFGPRTT